MRPWTRCWPGPAATTCSGRSSRSCGGRLGPAGRRRRAGSAAGPASSRRPEAVQLAGAQQDEELPAAAFEADPGDPALLELDPRARQVMHHLHEVRVVADEQRALT